MQLPYALTAIKGIGQRFGYLICRILGFDLHMKAGQCSEEQKEKLKDIIQNPTNYGVPRWFLNRQRDETEGKDMQLTSTIVDTYLRQDLERWKKIRSNRGLRHYWRIRVRGQKTCSTGRRGATMGVVKKK